MEPHVSYAFGLEDIDEDSEGTDGSGRFARWLHRRGRRFDDTERTIMGILDVSVWQDASFLPFCCNPSDGIIDGSRDTSYSSKSTYVAVPARTSSNNYTFTSIIRYAGFAVG